MQYTAHYQSPLGGILLAGDEAGLTGLWFDGARYAFRSLAPDHAAGYLPALDAARHWLDSYFAGREPSVAVPLHLTGTPFQLAVWALLGEIPYGSVTTYGALAKTLAAQRGLARLSAQAVGGAVGRNPVSLLIPCHRVVGRDGSLTGYAGGLVKKEALLRLEGVDTDALAVSGKGASARGKNLPQR